MLPLDEMERAEDEFGSETAILPLSLLNAEHDIIASNIKQVESNPNNFFIVFSSKLLHKKRLQNDLFLQSQLRVTDYSFSDAFSSFFASFLSFISAAPMKKQINPKNPERTGKLPFIKAITSGPQFNGPAGRTEKTVNATKIIPTSIEIILLPHFLILF